MGCDFVERQLAAYDRLGSGAADRVDDEALAVHLEKCASCRQIAADQRDVAALLASRPPIETSARFTSQVISRLEEAAGVFGMLDWRAWTFRLAPVAGALALLALFASAPSSTNTTPAPDPVVTIDEWAQAETSATGTAAWMPGTTSEDLIERMLTVSGGSSPERTDGR